MVIVNLIRVAVYFSSFNSALFWKLSCLYKEKTEYYNNIAASFSVAVVVLEGIAYLMELYKPSASTIEITTSSFWSHWELWLIAILLLLPSIITEFQLNN